MKATTANSLSHSFVHRPVGGYEFRIWKENIQKLMLTTDRVQNATCNFQTVPQMPEGRNYSRRRWLSQGSNLQTHRYATATSPANTASHFTYWFYRRSLKKHIPTTKLLITPNGFLEAIQRHQWHNLYIFMTCKFFIGQMLPIELFKFSIALA